MAVARDNLARKQIFIPANMPEEEIVLRVAAYCRVSTDSDDQINSFTAQNSHYMEMITAHDQWELVDIYADEGITGTSAKKRKDFQRLLADCRNGRIDKVLVKSISRFARNTCPGTQIPWDQHLLRGTQHRYQNGIQRDADGGDCFLRTGGK